ncbi:response regulator [Candidatus Woesearchaeota archaeon]|nr:response regulator [Candidatus Woesearchaeota archaeon]MCF7901477.1 response regulator [Candidatus Woesearchaeota archaeon]MCF8013190.1 response regulator [Candidatus Woesearchaeota archaeon]
MDFKTILSVEDDYDQISIFRNTFDRYNKKDESKYHLNFMSAITIGDAQNILKTSSIDLVLADLMLLGEPKKSHNDNPLGYIKEIKDLYPTLPIFVITGQSANGLKQKSKDAGVEKYFVKPFKNSELIKSIEDVFSSYDN